MMHILDIRCDPGLASKPLLAFSQNGDVLIYAARCASDALGKSTAKDAKHQGLAVENAPHVPF